MNLLKIAGAAVYDPAHGIDGAVQDVWIRGGKIVAPPDAAAAAQATVLDARGLIAMPGGVDMHCHIAGPKANAARRLRPEERRAAAALPRQGDFRSGTLGSVPSTFAVGYKYAGLGYTTAVDAAVAPVAARHVQEELADTPCLDKGYFILVSDQRITLDLIRRGDDALLRDWLGWLMAATQAMGLKLVNPGGVEAWKWGRAGTVGNLDERLPPLELTPREIITALARAADALGTRHPIHLHCNHLGLPGNWRTTLATMQALQGRRAHLAHVQFHSYGGGGADEATFTSRAAELAEYFNQHDHLTADVGQVLFGPTTSMTGDSPVGYYLANLYRTRWFAKEVEGEAGCGIAPIEYRDRNLVNAVQWAAGLEWFLLVRDPWRIALSTDQPNGASFLAYPQLIRLLMDREYRRARIAACHPKLRERSVLADLDRQYTLGEICTITRAAPARMLGLSSKGHLGVGADADVTLYSPHADYEQMFALPRCVIHGGQIVADQGELRAAPPGRLLADRVPFDRAIERRVAPWIERHYSIRPRNYALADQLEAHLAAATPDPPENPP